MLNICQKNFIISHLIEKYNLNNCRDCHQVLPDEPIYKQTNINVCNNCNSIRHQHNRYNNLSLNNNSKPNKLLLEKQISCTKILSYFKKDKDILNLHKNNIIPNLLEFCSENIYAEIKYIMYDDNEFYDKSNNGSNGNLIEDFIDFMIHGFILKQKRPKICFIDNRVPIENITDYETIKTELKHKQHDTHVKDIYDFFLKIHNEYNIIETQKNVKFGKYIGTIDIVCEKCLIDIKCIKQQKFCSSLMRKHFLQLIIYYCINNDINIKKLGIYDYYRGNIYWIDTQLIDRVKMIETINEYTKSA